MTLTGIISFVDRHLVFFKRGLLVVALLTFVVGMLTLLIDSLFPGLGIPQRFVPKSVLAAVVPGLSVLLVYELLLVILAARGPLVPFVRHMFELVSLIVLRDLFKKLEELSANGHTGLYLEVGVIAAGSLLLYFLAEVLQRIESNVVGQELTEQDLPKPNRRLNRLKDMLEIILLAAFVVLTLFEGIGWLLGIPGTGFAKSFLNYSFLGIIVFNFFLLFISLLDTDDYETLFEYSALLLASVIVFIALPLHPFIQLPMIIAAFLFVLITLFLHGFARGQRLGTLFRQLREREK
ncbi:MAG TPA: hypothetical protein VK978_01865 [Candidatus Saccharimonadales bacterium]|nr:hypothetical protein [Candidatus Saccharimonadales bacterium]